MRCLIELFWKIFKMKRNFQSETESFKEIDGLIEWMSQPKTLIHIYVVLNQHSCPVTIQIFGHPQITSNPIGIRFFIPPRTSRARDLETKNRWAKCSINQSINRMNNQSNNQSINWSIAFPRKWLTWSKFKRYFSESLRNSKFSEIFCNQSINQPVD